MPTYLITGGTGFVGSHLADVAVGRGTVRALARPGSDTKHLEAIGAEIVPGDLTDADALRKAVAGADVVIHCAAVPEPTRNAPHKVFGNNLMATFNVVEACVRMGADRLVNVSS